MKRYAATINLVEDEAKIAGYLAHHRAVWVEVLRSFRAVGVRDLRIWRTGTRLFYEMEVEDRFDPNLDFPRYAGLHSSNPVWENLMASLQSPLPGHKPGEPWSPMELAFDLDAQLHTLDTGIGLRVDSHQHFWNYSQSEYPWIGPGMETIARTFEPEHLHPLLSARSLHGCVAIQARCDERENDYLLGLSDRNPFVLGVVGWLDLAADTLEARLDAQAGRPKLVGLRDVLQGKPRHEWLSDAFVRGVRKAGERGFAYDILIFAHQLQDAHDLVRQCASDHRLVVDHLGKPDIRSGEFTTWAKGLRQLAHDFPNLHCKLSGMVTEAIPYAWTPAQLLPYMETVVEAFGVERVMYGSDWPVCLLGAHQYADVYDVAADYIHTLGADAEAAILGANAVRFYRLPSPNLPHVPL